MFAIKFPYKIKTSAFTLAEVLITLGIIGVVAALTIPALINTVKDMQYKTAYKKAYTTLSQAVNLCNADNLFVSASSNTDVKPTGFDQNFLALESKFSVVTACTNTGGDYKNCWEDSGEKWINGGQSGGSYPNGAGVYAFIDKSGMAWCQYWYGALRIFVDTNNFKGPNQWGKDRFILKVEDASNSDEFTMGTPLKVSPATDNTGGACVSPNKCATTHDYYGTSWLLNKN